MTILLIIVSLTILISANCSLFEAVLYSTRIGTLEVALSREAESKAARKFIEMKRMIAAPLSSVLILNTVANTAGAVVAGYYANEALGYGAMPLFSALMTLGILFLGEIAPKTLGAVYWRNLWQVVVWPIHWLTIFMYPVVVMIRSFTNILTKGQTTPTVTEEEILAAVRIGAHEGEISDGESAMVHNIINLENRPIHDIMTPRTVIFSLDAGLTIREATRALDQKGFTRIPIYEDDRENIIGYIMIHDLLSVKTLSNQEAKIKTIVKPISFVPETWDSLALLTSFLKKRRHIAIVVDEYGGVAGLVTLEDLIETLLGDEIVDETDRVVDLQERARQLSKFPDDPTVNGE
ncbi:MAG: hemolysin family protein [Deltaproteobacteria bacterium]|nr:hemolysin family protein [Deltaproteobacteria bacterium]